jgi:hypothetical protein
MRSGRAFGDGSSDAPSDDRPNFREPRTAVWFEWGEPAGLLV